MSRPQLPDATGLTRAQHAGWACVWCAKPLKSGAVLAGRAEGHIGAHDMSVDVYACPDCANLRPSTRQTGAN